MIVKIVRTFPNEKQTLGKLFIINESIIEFDCHTLELTWKDNKKDVSCIPVGTYRMKRRFSDKYGQHWHILDVPGRDMILIHTGNYVGSKNPKTNKPDSSGCILVGLGIAYLDNDMICEITESKKAMEEINNILVNDEYELIIK